MQEGFGIPHLPLHEDLPAGLGLGRAAPAGSLALGELQTGRWLLSGALTIGTSALRTDPVPSHRDRTRAMGGGGSGVGRRGLRGGGGGGT